MDKTYSLSLWYTQDDLVNAVNLCMEALERSGISAERAKLIPECLKRAIECSNDIAMGKTAFSSTPISVEREECSFKVSPFELSRY